MHKHETIMMTRFLMILCRAPRHPPGKEDVVKSVGVIFYLFCGCLLQEARLLMLSKWVSEWVSEWVSDGYNRIPILIQFLLDVHCTTHSLFWSTIEDEKHLTIISRWRVKKPKFSYISQGDRRNMKTYRKTFFFERGVPYRLNQRIMPSRSEYTFFFSSCRHTTKDDEHLKIIHSGLTGMLLKTRYFLKSNI